MPLTHLIQGSRAILNDGAGFAEIQQHLYILSAMTFVFLSFGAGFFRWQKR
jgi:ABC-type multidrug transport system permease subunit